MMVDYVYGLLTSSLPRMEYKSSLRGRRSVASASLDLLKDLVTRALSLNGGLLAETIQAFFIFQFYTKQIS